jgi:hypothetical protein
MPEFLSPTDIGNRAAQHCGAEMMDANLGFTEVSKIARQVSFVYGKLRRAELRRNIWRFSIRWAALRPIDTNTLLLAPTLWISTTTYFVGSIVADANNTFWISRIPNNVGAQPGVNYAAWEPYFGPLTVSLYDSSQEYLSGEIVYTAAGDGTYNAYLSLVSSNALHPALPNQWSVATTYFQNNVVQVFPAWAVGTTYAAGATVTYTDGNTYTSLVSGNVGITPSSLVNWALTPTLTLATQGVPETTTVTPPNTSPVLEWVQSTVYGLGGFVMFNGTEYVSIANNNTGNPPNATGSAFWAALSGGTLFMSLIDLNRGNNPTATPALWAVGTTYAAGAKVAGSDGNIYSSIGSGNVGNNPVTDGGVNWTNTGVLVPWTTVFAQGGGNDQWTQIGGALFPSGVGLSELNIVYPIGTGPLSQYGTRNVYRLPAGFLREAPQDPKAGSDSLFGAPTNRFYDDWNLEGNYITTSESRPIVFRFGADVQDVTGFDDMFCEGLAVIIAEAIAISMVEFRDRLEEIRTSKKMLEGRIVNGIETGATEPAMDDFLACRY